MSIAGILIAHARRKNLVRERVLPSMLAQPFDELVVVADYEADLPLNGFRWLVVEPLTATTIDGLVKRDVGTLATTADWLLYLNDDHALHEIPVRYPPNLPMIGVPTRFCLRDGIQMPLNSGLAETDPNRPYCGGHAGLFSRALVQHRPWSTMPRIASPRGALWDLFSSRLFVKDGATLLGPLEDFVIEDLEPAGQPWR